MHFPLIFRASQKDFHVWISIDSNFETRTMRWCLFCLTYFYRLFLDQQLKHFVHVLLKQERSSIKVNETEMFFWNVIKWLNFNVGNCQKSMVFFCVKLSWKLNLKSWSCFFYYFFLLPQTNFLFHLHQNFLKPLENAKQKSSNYFIHFHAFLR